MNSESLWGDLTDLHRDKSPKQLLEEQAQLLNEIVQGLLCATVEIAIHGSNMSVNLIIVAPALNNYRYSVLSIFYDPANMYPVHVKNATVESSPLVKCSSESEFVECLRVILSSSVVRKAIGSLISHSEK